MKDNKNQVITFELGYSKENLKNFTERLTKSTCQKLDQLKTKEQK